MTAAYQPFICGITLSFLFDLDMSSVEHEYTKKKKFAVHLNGGGNMELMRKTTLLILVSLLVFGCSKKQEDAAKIEQEMIQQEAAADSATVAQEPAEEVMAVDSEIVDADAEAIPAEEPEATMPPRPTGDGFAVQVASCESADYARYLIDKYTKRDFEPYISEISVEGQLYHRVRLGPYETLTEAKEIQARLLSDYSQESWIDPVAQ